MTRTQIRAEVKKLFREMKQSTVPVDLEKVLAFLDFDLTQIDFSSFANNVKYVAGATDYTNGKIFVNSADGYYRRRFTVAHEIGHNVLHHNTKEEAIFAIQSGTEVIYDSEKQKEKEANIFAAELLLPYERFKNDYKVLRTKIDELVQMYSVSRFVVVRHIQDCFLPNANF